MRVQLLDVSVLVAMHNPAHPHNEAALRWFNTEGKTRWATCPMTENGFVRVHTNTLFVNQRSGVYEACFILETMKQTYGSTHRFWNDSVSLNDAQIFMPLEIVGPKQIADIYLLGLCQKRGATFVTFDTAMSTRAIVSPHAELLLVLPTP